MSKYKKVVDINHYRKEKEKAEKKAEKDEIIKRIIEKAKKLDW